MKLPTLKTNTYIIAVSGGVDSVALFNILAENTDSHLIVAHFDHGTREDSRNDAIFVRELAEEYGLEFISERADLGGDVSEEKARQARYNFLFKVKEQYQAAAIITAHHFDDVIETMMINLIRGTGWRGLCSLRDTDDILRPLLAWTKADVISYATTRHLKWHEDSTNQNRRYLRNQLRHEVMPKLTAAQRQQWQKLYEAQCALLTKIESEGSALLAEAVEDQDTFARYPFIMWPTAVAIELLRQVLTLTRPHAGRVLLAIRTARTGTTQEVSQQLKLHFTDKTFIVEKVNPVIR